MFECELCGATDCECDLKGLIDDIDDKYCDICFINEKMELCKIMPI